MNDLEKIKLLPKVEVSFQDDFSGSKREFTLTPSYIKKTLDDAGIKINIGDKVLLWEKDAQGEGEHYICTIGEIVIATDDLLKNESSISPQELSMLNEKPFIIKINNDDFFNLPMNSHVFN